MVPTTNAIVGIDLADAKQMVVVTDHDSKVLARKTFRCHAWDLGAALDWAAQRATAKGFTGVTVACEPTGHRWRVLGQLVADRGMPFVCVQPMVTSWSRRTEDLTFDKTDEKDAVLIAVHRLNLEHLSGITLRYPAASGGKWTGRRVPDRPLAHGDAARLFELFRDGSFVLLGPEPGIACAADWSGRLRTGTLAEPFGKGWPPYVLIRPDG